MAERGPRAPGRAPCLSETISYNSAISACEKGQQSKFNSFFDYGALEDDHEFVGVLDHDDEVNEEESLRVMNYNSAISTCEKGQQWSKAHCTAARQCNVAEGSPEGPPKPKNVNGYACGHEHRLARGG